MFRLNWSGENAGVVAVLVSIYRALPPEDTAERAPGPRVSAGLETRDAVDLHRDRAARVLDRDLVRTQGLELIAAQQIGRLADQDVGADLLRRRLQTRGAIHPIAKERVLAFVPLDPDVPGHDLARVDADPHADR